MSDLTLVSKLEQDLRSLDLSKVVKYTQKLDDLTQGANTLNAPIFIRDFILAYDETNLLLAKAMRYQGQVKAALETAEAIAYFDKAPDYLKAKGVKDSSEAKKMYIPIDEDVQRAKHVYAQAEAMVSLLKNKLYEFRAAHESVKKMAYSGDYSNSAYEG